MHEPAFPHIHWQTGGDEDQPHPVVTTDPEAPRSYLVADAMLAERVKIRPIS